MKGVFLRFVLLSVLCSIPIRLSAQEEWKAVPMVGLTAREPMPFLHAIGIPATATYDGKKLQAYVFLWGREKETGIGYPTIGVYVENIRDLVPENEYQQFIGPDLSNAAIHSKTVEIAISTKDGTQTHSEVMCIGWSSLSDSAIPLASEYFDVGLAQSKEEKASWNQFLLAMSSGFDHGHISLGGRVFSKKVEVDFSGNGIGPLLNDLIQFAGR